jgi:hypothetical protein
MDQTPLVPSRSQNSSSSSAQDAQPGELNDDLVRQIADRVYRMLMQDLKYDQERLRLVYKKTSTRKGGR